MSSRAMGNLGLNFEKKIINKKKKKETANQPTARPKSRQIQACQTNSNHQIYIIIIELNKIIKKTS